MTILRWCFYLYSDKFVNALIISETDLTSAGWYVRNNHMSVLANDRLGLDSFTPGNEILVICNEVVGIRV